MTKEEALKKIEELKDFVKKCDEEIPPMPERGNYCVHTAVTDGFDGYEIRDLAFDNNHTAKLYSVFSFELLHLLYARSYLGIKGRVKICSSLVYYIVWGSGVQGYIMGRMPDDETPVDIFSPWFFNDGEAAKKVLEYMNKHVRTYRCRVQRFGESG